jgi:phage baseplate assembly protein W
MFRLDIPLGENAQALAGGAAQRIAMVLETRPGTIPWRPTFGCDFRDLVGLPATEELVTTAEWRVREALGRWVRDAEVLRVEVSLVPTGGAAGGFSSGPIAENSLLSMGIQAAIEIEVEVRTADGVVSVASLVNP